MPNVVGNIMLMMPQLNSIELNLSSLTEKNVLV